MNPNLPLAPHRKPPAKAALIRAVLLALLAYDLPSTTTLRVYHRHRLSRLARYIAKEAHPLQLCPPVNVEGPSVQSLWGEAVNCGY